MLATECKQTCRGQLSLTEQLWHLSAVVILSVTLSSKYTPQNTPTFSIALKSVNLFLHMPSATIRPANILMYACLSLLCSLF